MVYSNYYCYRNRMGLASTQTFYLLINNKTIANMGSDLSQIYEEEKSEDGFLYMVYASHESFGWLVIYYDNIFLCLYTSKVIMNLSCYELLCSVIYNAFILIYSIFNQSMEVDNTQIWYTANFNTIGKLFSYFSCPYVQCMYAYGHKTMHRMGK